MIETKDLELQVREHVSGKLLTNAIEIRDFVLERVQDYTPEKYTGDDLKEAKADRATLNKAADELNGRRLELERQWMEPFRAFKDVVNETVRAIKDASSQIGDVISAVEDREKAERRAEIEAVFAENEGGFDLVPLDRIFDERWLNKSTSRVKWVGELQAKMTKIREDMAALADIDDATTVQAYYLRTLDIAAALQHAQELKRNRAAIEQRARVTSIGSVNISTEPNEQPDTKHDPAPAPPRDGEYGPHETETMTITLRLTGSRSQLVALRAYIDQNRISYEKVGS